jgi:hypothetical protein
MLGLVQLCATFIVLLASGKVKRVSDDFHIASSPIIKQQMNQGVGSEVEERSAMNTP